MKKNGKIRRGRKRVRTLPPGLRKAVDALDGTTSTLASKVGVSPQAVSVWRKVPEKHLRRIHRLTGVPLEELRPDLFRLFRS